MTAESRCTGCERRCTCRCCCQGHSHMRYCERCAATAHDVQRGLGAISGR